MRRRDPASFRDPDGFVFRQEGEVFRHVAAHYRPTYDLLKGSGLYADLISAGLLVPHAELGEVGAGAFLIKPDKVPFISYPFEWSFEQLRDAASATLDVMERALAKGLWLKDASAYNTQFLQGAPTLIDTLSFEAYRDGEGWPAYHQFCKHFLAPLAIMRWKGAAMSRLLVSHIDGVPLDLASRLLPWRSHVSLGIALHVHGHAKAQRWYAAQQPVKPKRVAKNDVVNLVRHLKGTVEGLKTPSVQGHWADYCDNTNYTPAAIAQKQTLIERVAAAARPSLALDLGANTGLFSRIVAQHAGFVVSADSDPDSVSESYRVCRRDGLKNVLPVVLDVANPWPGIGWENRERPSFFERVQSADLVLALALVHHLVISNNLPLTAIAEAFASIGKTLVIEWVPKDDSQVQRMLSTRRDVFESYNEDEFRRAFGQWFHIRDVVPIVESKRKLYVLETRGPQ